MISKEIARVTNSVGRTFAVHLVPAGGQYGRNDVVANTYGQAMVEFWDTSHEGNTDFDHRKRGQFVSRYLISTFLDRSPSEGLLLHGSEADVWFVDAVNCSDVVAAITLERNTER